MATQTFRDFMTECECYEYSQENYNLMKEAYEIDLMEQYLKNQAFALENADVINTEDGYTFTEGMFVEASGIDMEKNNLLLEEVEQKKAGFFKKIWEGFKKVISKIISFFKRLVTGKIFKDAVATHKAWKEMGGSKAVLEHIKKYGSDSADTTADVIADNNDLSDEAREKLHKKVGKQVKKVKKPTTSQETPNETKSDTADNSKNDTPTSPETLYEKILKDVFKRNSTAKEFFSDESSRKITYKFEFNPETVDNVLGLLAGKGFLKIKVNKHPNDATILSYDAIFEILGENPNEPNFVKLYNINKRAVIKDGINLIFSSEGFEKYQSNLNEMMSEANAKVEKLTNDVSAGKASWDEKASNLQMVVADFTKAIPEYLSLLSAIDSFAKTFIQVANEYKNK